MARSLEDRSEGLGQGDALLSNEGSLVVQGLPLEPDQQLRVAGGGRMRRARQGNMRSLVGDETCVTEARPVWLALTNFCSLHHKISSSIRHHLHCHRYLQHVLSVSITSQSPLLSSPSSTPPPPPHLQGTLIRKVVLIPVIRERHCALSVLTTGFVNQKHHSDED